MIILLIAALLWVGGIAGCGLNATLLVWRMVDEVNERRPKEKRFAHIGWWPGKTLDLYYAHREIFPDSPTRGRLLGLTIAMFALVAALALVLLLMSPGAPA